MRAISLVKNLGLVSDKEEELNWFYPTSVNKVTNQGNSPRTLIFSLIISKAGVELAHLVDELTDQASPDDAEERSSD